MDSEIAAFSPYGGATESKTEGTVRNFRGRYRRFAISDLATGVHGCQERVSFLGLERYERS
jgi:hypothetical protein